MTFSPDRDIPDLTGKVILVTGGNSGLGKESIIQLAKHHPQQILMGARSKTKAESAIEEVRQIVPDANITFVEMDLSSFTSIRNAAKTVLQYDRLDILINNAGLMGVDPGLTKDGYEIQFGSNHIGPALLTKLLIPLMLKTTSLGDGDVRIVQLSSLLHKFSPKGGIQYSRLTTPMADLSGTARYGQSKLANLYFIKALAKKYPTIKCASLHPGVVKTGLLDNTQKSSSFSWFIALGRKLFFTDVHTGALGQLWAAAGNPNEIKSGAYYMPLKKEVKGDPTVDDSDAAEKLWNWTEEVFKKHGIESS